MCSYHNRTCHSPGAARIDSSAAASAKQNQIVTANQHLSTVLSDHTQSLLKILHLIQQAYEFLAKY